MPKLDTKFTKDSKNVVSNPEMNNPNLFKSLVSIYLVRVKVLTLPILSDNLLFVFLILFIALLLATLFAKTINNITPKKLIAAIAIDNVSAFILMCFRI